MLHLHRFDSDDDRAGLDISAVVDAYRDDRSGHGAGQFRIPAVLIVRAYRCFAHLLERHEDPVAGKPYRVVRSRDRVLDAHPVEGDGQPFACQIGLQ